MSSHQKRLLPTRPQAWERVVAKPVRHDGEETWHSDRLVAIGGDWYPPRFRLSLTCGSTKVSACVSVRVERGGFLFSTPDVTPGCPETFSKTAHKIMSGGSPTLARLIAMVPDAIVVLADGRWHWSVLAWAWAPEESLPPELKGSLSHLEQQAEPKTRNGVAEGAKGKERRFREVKRRMRQSWWKQVLPELYDYAELMRLRGLSRNGLIDTLQKMNLSRSQAYAKVALAAEVGLLGDGARPICDLPRLDSNQTKRVLELESIFSEHWFESCLSDRGGTGSGLG